MKNPGIIQGLIRERVQMRKAEANGIRDVMEAAETIPGTQKSMKFNWLAWLGAFPITYQPSQCQ
jgi:hypothetical protein